MSRAALCGPELRLALLKAVARRGALPAGGATTLPAAARAANGIASASASTRNLSAAAPGISHHQPGTNAWRQWQKAVALAVAVACPVGAFVLLRSGNAFEDEGEVALASVGPRRITDVCKNTKYEQTRLLLLLYSCCIGKNTAYDCRC